VQSYQTLDDSRLAELAQDDADAFDALYRRHVTAIYRYCYGRVENEPDAEDLTAQVFLAALESLRRYRGRGSFPAWLFGIARNKCNDFYRTVYHEPKKVSTSAESSDSHDLSETLADTHAEDPEESLILAGILGCVERMVAYLSADRLEALRLRYWGGLSMAEIANVMRRTEAAAKMLVSRAISDLRERCVIQ